MIPFKLTLILAIAFTSCNGSIERKKYEAAHKWKLDSMQIINKTLDSFPADLKQHPYLINLYNRNLDSTSAELKKYIKMIAPSPAPLPDTTIKPVYQYYYRSMIPVHQLRPTLDTLDMIMEEYGIDMMGSRSASLKQLFNQKLSILLSGLAVDSVRVDKPKGGKP
jgi:hypothetical protein